MGVNYGNGSLSFHLTFISPHIVIIQMRLRLITISILPLKRKGLESKYQLGNQMVPAM